MNKVLAAGVVGVTCAVSALAVDNSWQRVNGVLSGSFDDDAHWSRGFAPITNDVALVNVPSGSVLTNTFPSGVYDTKASLRFNLQGQGATAYVFDGRGSVVRQPANDTACYNDEPFGFRYGGGNGAHFFNLQTYWDKGADHNRAALSTVTNGFARWGWSDNAAHLDLDFLGGDWNLYDPDGTPYGARIVYICAPSKIAGDMRLRFHEGSHVRLPQIVCPARVKNGGEMLYDFIGGRHEIMGKVDVPSQYGYNDDKGVTTTFQATNGAEVVFGGDVILGGRAASGSYGGQPFYDRTYRLVAKGAGSKMTFNGPSVQNVTGGTFRFDVTDGAEADVWSELDLDYTSDVTSVVTVAGATLKTRKVNVGGTGVTNQVAKIVARDGAVLDFTGDSWDVAGTVSVRAGSLEASNATVKAGSLYVGYGAETGAVSLTDTAVDFGDELRLGRMGRGEMTLDNVASTFAARLYVGSETDTTAQFGKLVVTNTPTLALTGLSAGNAEIDLYGCDVTNGGGTFLGCDGSGRMTLHGGSLTVSDQLDVGRTAGKRGELTLTDGAALIADASQQYVYVGNNANSTGRLEVVSGSSVTLRHSDGWLLVGNHGAGELLVDGGTVTATTVHFSNDAKAVGKGEMRSGTIVCENFCVGYSGAGEFVMAGGDLTTHYVFLGQNGNADASVWAILRQTGGTITVTALNRSDTGVKTCDASNRRCRVILDGGTFACDHFFGHVGAKCRGGSGLAELYANGGTISVPKIGSVRAFGVVENYDTAKLGALGLTITSADNVSVPQDFADQDDAVGQGLLRLAGTGTKTLSATNSTVSRIDVAEGAVKFAAAEGSEKTQASSVTVAGGATLALDGALSTLTVKGLTLGDASGAARLVVRPGDKILVTDELVVNNAGLVLEGTFATGSDYDCLQVAGDRRETLADAWSKIRIVSGRGEGQGYCFSVRYDEGTQKTSVRLTVVDASDELSDVRWNGATGVWGTDANWEGGAKPATTDRAVFDSETAESDVTLGGPQPLAALAFGAAKGYALSGGWLAFSDLSQSSIDVTKGSNVVSSAMALPNEVPVTVASGAALDASGDLQGGTVTKDGRGRLILSGANTLAEVIVSNGTYATQGADAWGGVQKLKMNGGAVSLRGDPSAETHLDVATVIGAPLRTPVLLQTDTDVVMPAWKHEYGMPYKSGAGCLTLEVGKDQDGARLAYESTADGWEGTKQDWCPNLNGTHPKSIVTFDADGLIPADIELGGVTVADGELAVRGVRTDKVPQYNMMTYVVIGEPGAASSAPPTLTLDNVYVNAARSGRHVLPGAGLADNNTTVTDVYVNVTNGATLVCDTFYVARAASRTGLKPHIRVADRSVIRSTYMMHANCCTGAGSEADIRVLDGSKLLTGSSINFGTRAKLVVDNSILAKNEALEPTALTYKANVSASTASGGDLVFRNGAKAYLSSIATYASATKPTTLTFDGAEWIPGTGDFTFEFDNPDKVQIVAEGDGLVLDVPNAKTWTMNAAVSGAGGIVKRGAGTLAVAPDALACTGVTVVEAGALDLQGGDVTMTGGLATTGAGVVRNGTLTCSVPFAVDDDWNVLSGTLPNLDASVTVRRLVIDFGRTAENPVAEPFKTIVIGAYAGAAPSLANWRVAGTGLHNVRGVFEAKDGRILLTLERTGALLIVR